MRFGLKIKDQRGMASILTASIVMIIVGLITVGFARLMAREHRQALDRQLSTQAFYAAESGINDAREGLKSTQVAKQTCDVSSASLPYVQNGGVVDATKGIAYTCLIVDPNPTTLEYDNSTITPNAARIARVESANNASIPQLRIGWETEGITDSTSNGCSISSNPVASAWPTDAHALLRVDIVPANNLNRNSLIDGTMSMYLYPDIGCAAASVNFSAGISRRAVPCSSSAGRDCNLTITLPVGGSSIYYVRLNSVYKNANASITPLDGSGQPTIATKNGQAMIDVTGRSNDVVRRMQVRVPIQEDVNINSVLSTTDSICKLFTLTTGPSGVRANDTTCD